MHAFVLTLQNLEFGARVGLVFDAQRAESEHGANHTKKMHALGSERLQRGLEPMVVDLKVSKTSTGHQFFRA